MNLNDDKWGDLKEKVFDKFPGACANTDFTESEDDLGHKFEVKIDSLIFQSPMGELKIERETRPKIIDKKTHYHKGAGGAKVEYIFSEDEKTFKVEIFKKNDAGEWQTLDIPAENLNI